MGGYGEVGEAVWSGRGRFALDLPDLAECVRAQGGGVAKSMYSVDYHLDALIL